MIFDRRKSWQQSAWSRDAISNPAAEIENRKKQAKNADETRCGANFCTRVYRNFYDT
jgi:hypothetical protein